MVHILSQPRRFYRAARGRFVRKIIKFESGVFLFFPSWKRWIALLRSQ